MTYLYLLFFNLNNNIHLQLIDIAFRTDPMKVNSLLERRNQRWGNRNMIEISYIAHLRVFVASKQSKITNTCVEINHRVKICTFDVLQIFPITSRSVVC